MKEGRRGGEKRKEREGRMREGRRGGGKEDWISQMCQVEVIFPFFEYMGTVFLHNNSRVIFSSLG